MSDGSFTSDARASYCKPSGEGTLPDVYALGAPSINRRHLEPPPPGSNATGSTTSNGMLAIKGQALSPKTTMGSWDLFESVTGVEDSINAELQSFEDSSNQRLSALQQQHDRESGDSEREFWLCAPSRLAQDQCAGLLRNSKPRKEQLRTKNGMLRQEQRKHFPAWVHRLRHCQTHLDSFGHTTTWRSRVAQHLESAHDSYAVKRNLEENSGSVEAKLGRYLEQIRFMVPTHEAAEIRKMLTQALDPCKPA